MIEKLRKIDIEVKELLEYATAKNKVESELEKYLDETNRTLYLKYCNGILVGCIGILILTDNTLEIIHIATKETHRFKRIGSHLIAYVEKTYAPLKVIAETDSEAVGFYRNYGFEIQSLGEKYPGVERFNCVKLKK